MKEFERVGVPGQETPQTEETRRAEAISRYIDLRVVGTNEAVDEDELKDRKSTRLNSSHLKLSRMPSSA